MAVTLILLAYGLRGIKQGLIRTIFGMCSFVIALAAAAFLGPTFSEAIKTNEYVVPYVTQKVETEKLTLPEVLKKALEDKDALEEYKQVAAEKTEDYVKIRMANWIINALSFVIVFFVALVILWYLCHTLDIISKLPILNGINKLAGMLAGLLRGLITIWMLCIVLTIFSSSQIGQLIFSYINKNEFLSLIYNHNLLFQIGKIIL